MFGSKRRAQKRGLQLAQEALQAVQNGDYAYAYETAEAAEQNGNTFAPVIIGYLYAHGLGVETNAGKAQEYFKKAYANGEPEAAYHLGMLIRTHSVAGTDEEAFQLIKSSAEAGIDFAYYELAISYYKGVGCRKDDALAFEWMKKAAENGTPEGLAYYAFFRMSGTGTEPAEQNFNEGLQDLMAQGMLGNEEAVKLLKICFPDRNWEQFFAENR